MVAVLLGTLLILVPGPPPNDLDECLKIAPEESPPPVHWGPDLQRMWSAGSIASTDSIHAYLAQVREARACLLAIDPSSTERPYLDHVIETFYVEAGLLAALRQFPKAFGKMREAQSFLASDPPIPAKAGMQSSWSADLHRDQGYLHYLLGNLSAAIDQYVKSLRTHPKDHIGDRTARLLDIGLLHQRTQDYSSARYYYLRANKLLRSNDFGPDDHPSYWARLLHYEADLLLEKTLNTRFDRNAVEKATNRAQRSRSMADPGSERHARTSILLSESLGYLGEYERAYRLNAEVRAYARAQDDARLQTFSLLKLGVLHMQTERWAAADTALSRALAAAVRLGDLDYQRRILRACGRLHEMQGQWTTAEKYYRQGIAVVEKYRESLTASQWSMTAFAQWRDVHRGLVRSLVAQDRDRDALGALDRSRARHLQDLRTQARVANQLPPAQRTRLDSLSRALTNVRNELGNGSLSTREEAVLRDRETSLMAARQDLLDVDSASSALSIGGLSDVLAARDRVLVSYFLDDPWAVYGRTPRSTAFVVTGDTLQTVPLPGITQDSVQANVEAISPLFTSRGKPDRSNTMHFNLHPLHRLHEALYAPVREHLPSDRPMTVVPDGPLFHLPFSMLVDSMPGGRFSPSEAQFVLHERPTSLELASSLVADTAHSTHDWSQFEPQMAAYGVSEFDTLTTLPSALRNAVPEALSGSTVSPPPLPGAEKELNALKSRFPDARVALNDAATEEAVCQSVRTAAVVHVASHAFVNPTSPLQNAILLRSGRTAPSHTPAANRPSRSAPDSTSETGSDGALFLHELQGQVSSIPMVVLSGCSTAKGTLRGGEGMEGLQYAFRAMGAQSTVSALWPVADDANVELMDAFYAHIGDGYAKDEALRQARLHILRTRADWASPFFWAPTVLYGSSAPLPLEGRLLPIWAWLSLGFAGLLLLVGLLLWWNRTRLPPPFCHLVPR